jgi:hypothetical protein
MTQPGPTTADVGPLKKYGMLLWTVAGIVFMAYYAALSGDGRVDLDEGLTIGTVGVQALVTYVVPQTPRFRFAKNAAAGVIAALALGGQFFVGLVDGWEQQQVVFLIATVLTAAGALVLPAVSDNGVGSGLGANEREPITAGTTG